MNHVISSFFHHHLISTNFLHSLRITHCIFSCCWMTGFLDFWYVIFFFVEILVASKQLLTKIMLSHSVCLDSAQYQIVFDPNSEQQINVVLIFILYIQYQYLDFFFFFPQYVTLVVCCCMYVIHIFMLNNNTRTHDTVCINM